MTKPDIITILENEGIELKQKGLDSWGLCPLHTEKTPSFKVNPERQTFHCFGCNESGDVIEFIQKLHGLDFKGALNYLGINNNQRVKPDPVLLRARDIRKQYEAWKYRYCLHLADLLRLLDKKKTTFKDMKQVEQYATHYHEASKWEIHFDLLMGNDEEKKFELFKELAI